MKTGCTLILTLASLSNLLNAITIPCYETYEAESGRSCYPCGPGFYKFSNCVKNAKQARCFKCGADEYQPYCGNSTKCIKCRPHCPPGQVKVKNCSDIADIECQCKNGWFWEPDLGKPEEGNCKKHRPCKPGEGLLEKGNPTKDTKCTKCQKDVTYSDRESLDSCIPCSRCNTTVVRNCSLNHDSVCGVETPNLNSYAKSESLGAGAIAGIVIAVALVLLVASVACLWYSLFGDREKSDVELNGIIRIEQMEEGLDGNLLNNCFLPDNINGYKYPQQIQKPVVQNGHEVSNRLIEEESANEVEVSQNVSANGIATNSLTNSDDVVEQGVRNENNNYETSTNSASTMNNDDESSECSDLSTGADPVQPRSLQQSSRSEGHTGNGEASLNDMERQHEQNVTDKEVATSVADYSSVDTAMPVRPEGFSEPIQTEAVWMEACDFLGCYLKLNDFKRFYRWLFEMTNKELLDKAEVDIEHMHTNTRTDCRESIYQLMQSWRQATPKATLQDVLKALEKVNLVKNCESLMKIMKQKGICVACCDKDDQATGPAELGEISTPDSTPLEDMPGNILPQFNQGANLQMMVLKEQY